MKEKETTEDDRILINTLKVRDMVKVVMKIPQNYTESIASSIGFSLMRIVPDELSKYIETIKTKSDLKDDYYPVIVKWVMDDLKGGEFNLTSKYMFGMFSMATIDFNASSLTQRILESKIEHMLGGDLFLAQIEQVNSNAHMLLSTLKEEKKYLEFLRFLGKAHRDAMREMFTLMDNMDYYRKTLKHFEKMVHYQNVSLLKDMG